MPKTLTGLISYGPSFPSGDFTADGTLFFKTDDVGAQRGLYLYGIKDAAPGTFGNQITQAWTLTSGVSGSSGVLGIINGGTGNSSVVPGAVVYGDSAAMAYTTVGTAGQVLISSGSSQPIWASQNTLNVNSANSATSAASATTATSATTAQIAVTLANAGNTSLPMTFNWSGTAGQPAWLWGSNDGITSTAYNPSNFSVAFATTAGTATSATSATSATFANSATTLATSRNITLSGGASGSAAFNGSVDASISVTVNNVQGSVPNAAAAPSTLALRDSSGYLFAAYLNQSSPSNEGGTIAQIITTNGTDNFLRKASVAQLATSLSGSFVAKGGDTMTGSLTVPFAAVGAVSLPASGSLNVQSNITAFGFMSAVGSISTASGQIIAVNGNVQVGSTGTSGYARLQSSGTSNSGYLEFYGVNLARAGYIGNTASAATQDTGTINYIAAVHAFTGNITATGNVTAYSSDGRLKKNLVLIENAVQKVIRLGGYSYDWDMPKCLEVGFQPANEHEHGLIAQDVQRVMPDAVAPAPFNDKYLTVRYERIVALLTAAMGEQQRELDELRTRLGKLETNKG